jgi:hypothetical protein
MKSAYALILACLPVISGCEQQESRPPTVLEKYGNIPIGSRIVVRIHSREFDGVVTEPKTALLRATGRGEFEGSLLSINEEGIVMQPLFSRSQVFFGATVIREIQTIPSPGG